MRQLAGLVATSFGLVALYLLLTNAYGASTILREGGSAWVGLIKALQGR